MEGSRTSSRRAVDRVGRVDVRVDAERGCLPSCGVVRVAVANERHDVLVVEIQRQVAARRQRQVVRLAGDRRRHAAAEQVRLVLGRERRRVTYLGPVRARGGDDVDARRRHDVDQIGAGDRPPGERILDTGFHAGRHDADRVRVGVGGGFRFGVDDRRAVMAIVSARSRAKDHNSATPERSSKSLFPCKFRSASCSRNHWWRPRFPPLLPRAPLRRVLAPCWRRRSDPCWGEPAVRVGRRARRRTRRAAQRRAPIRRRRWLLRGAFELCDACGSKKGMAKVLRVDGQSTAWKSIGVVAAVNTNVSSRGD